MIPTQLKVVRWSTKIIPAKKLEYQYFLWGGFEATALCFCPYDEIGDERYVFWKNDVIRHHKKEIFPNHYILDFSTLPFKDEKELIETAKKAHVPYYSDIEKIFFTEHKIHITLSQYENIITLKKISKLGIIEFRLYPGNKVKILDNKNG